MLKPLSASCYSDQYIQTTQVWRNSTHSTEDLTEYKCHGDQSLDVPSAAASLDDTIPGADLCHLRKCEVSRYGNDFPYGMRGFQVRDATRH